MMSATKNDWSNRRSMYYLLRTHKSYCSFFDFSFDGLNATEFNDFDYGIHESVEVKITDHAASFHSNQAPMRYVEIVLRGNGEASSYTLHEERTGTNHNEQRTGTNHNEQRTGTNHNEL